MNGVNADEALMKNLPVVSWTLLLSTQSHWVLSWHFARASSRSPPEPAICRKKRQHSMHACSAPGSIHLYTDGNNSETWWVTVWVLGHPKVNIIQNKCMYMATLQWCHSSKMCPIMSLNSDITNKSKWESTLKSYCLFNPLQMSNQRFDLVYCRFCSDSPGVFIV